MSKKIQCGVPGCPGHDIDDHQGCPGPFPGRDVGFLKSKILFEGDEPGAPVVAEDGFFLIDAATDG